MKVILLSYSHLCFCFWGTRRMEFELAIFRNRVRHGLKEMGCSAAFRTYMSDPSISTIFNESCFVFLCSQRIELLRGMRILLVANSYTFPEFRVSEPPIWPSLRCPRNEKRTCTKCRPTEPSQTTNRTS